MAIGMLHQRGAGLLSPIAGNADDAYLFTKDVTSEHFKEIFVRNGVPKQSLTDAISNKFYFLFSNYEDVEL